MGTVLLALSLIYRALIGLRQVAYRAGALRSRSLPVRVVSVGNMTVGGTGKTPTVLHLVERYQERGMRPAVLSRGYGRPDEAAVLVVADGRADPLGPDVAGDEPAMLANRLRTVPVVVGRDRYQAGLLAIERFGPDLVVLDDGFQHFRLKRDLDIVLVDGVDPFGNGKLFPAGILREPLSALKRAQVIVITRSDRAADLEGLKRTIRAFSNALIVSGTYRPIDLVDVATGKVRQLDVLQGASVLAFAGIARPDSLENVLASLGADITSFRSYPDHHRYTRADLKVLLDEAARTASLLVTTEKDGVKLKGLATAGIWMLRIGLEIKERDMWENAVCPRQ